ncbi:hypothetical protein Cri9333_3494 [Crinalium epipsammum PCC 9333]|uniref:Glycosyltransferase RgtA/B/C/D-like domain-containing protein n=1 Tax=Crinalium epipsammum PCC 9333 TaxID=1173022 RepID=K9W3E7_9CYAN|nr:hypothetical protein [Crinalium epipsammum]AFZ14319.1 hypothetical protein Cri9333_3494 [Crinalium epipsammum PCC 9333]
MAEGLTFALIWAAFWTMLLSFAMCNQYITKFPSLVIASIKTLIPTCYSAYFYNGDWTFLDDVGYYEQGQTLLDLGYNPLTIIIDPEGLERIFAIANGQHILYVWWNIFAQYFFGSYYYSPVFLNVLITFVTAYFIIKIAELCNFSKNYKKSLYIFMLFQWDILAWSSFINSKDTLVMCLSVMALYGILKLFEQNNKTIFNLNNLFFLMVSSLSLYLLFFIRFYTIPLIFLTIIIFLIIKQQVKSFLFLILFTVLFTTILSTLANFIYDVNSFSIKNVLTGILRMIFTPLPWQIEESYTFLVIPSILNLLFLIPVIIVGCKFWKISKPLSLLLIYLIVALIFYGFLEEFQGPRQRYQLTFIIGWLQFHVLWVIFIKTTQSNKYFTYGQSNNSKID